MPNAHKIYAYAFEICLVGNLGLCLSFFFFTLHFPLVLDFLAFLK